MSGGPGPALPRPAPPVNPETEPFWAAAAEGRLLVGYCPACDLHFFYPRARCPDCLGEADHAESEGVGEVYSYTVVRQAAGEYAEATPFVLAYVELAEGPRLLTNLVDVDPDAVTVGRDVEVCFQDAGEYAVPRFRPR